MIPDCIIPIDGVVIGLWASSTETVAHTDAGIPNTITGYTTELRKLGQATAAPPDWSMGADTTFPIRMRPLFDIEMLYSGSRVLLWRMSWHGIDVTLDGAAEQDAAVLTAIAASRGTVNDAYAQSVLRNGELPMYAPNGFRPRFFVNGFNVLGALERSAFGTKSNVGDLSMGLPLPWCWEPPYPIDLGRPNAGQLIVEGPATQWVNVSGGRLQRYALLATAEFYLTP